MGFTGPESFQAGDDYEGADDVTFTFMKDGGRDEHRGPAVIGEESAPAIRPEQASRPRPSTHLPSLREALEPAW